VDDPHDRAYSREPQLDDLARLGRALNAHQVRYVLIGVMPDRPTGFSAGGVRLTARQDRTRKRRTFCGKFVRRGSRFCAARSG
jgi:hypothetical protein